MVQLGLILRLFTLATLRTADCSYDGHGAMPQGRKIPKASERKPLPVSVPYRGSLANLFLSAPDDKEYYSNGGPCMYQAINDGHNVWSSKECRGVTVSAPVCSYEISKNDTGYMIVKSFLTDGSPDDDPNLSLSAKQRFVSSNHIFAFRVMTPTIAEFPEFTTKIAFRPPSLRYERSIQVGKIFVLPKLGGLVTTDDSILVDPSCHTNNSCGVAFLSASVEVFKTPHVALDQFCGQTIHLNDNPVLNVFSHAGIGCKLFPDVYTTPNCELTITSNSAISANVTLVNFRKTTCDGYELKFLNFTCEGVSKEVDVCQENAPTVFDSSDGKMQIKLTGSASENWHRYGFIIRLEKVTKNDNFSQCSSDNSVQGATEDFPQGSTKASAESPTNSPVQGATEDFPQGSTPAPAESPTNSPVQGATEDFPQGLTAAPAESPTYSPVQGATEDFPQASTTSPAESPTNNPVQNPTDGSDVDSSEASLESSSATEFIRDPTKSFESESLSTSPKSPTNPHHLHLLLALAIEA